MIIIIIGECNANVWERSISRLCSKSRFKLFSTDFPRISYSFALQRKKKHKIKKLRQREILSGMFSLISLKLLLGGSVAFYFSFFKLRRRRSLRSWFCKDLQKVHNSPDHHHQCIIAWLALLAAGLLGRCSRYQFIFMAFSVSHEINSECIRNCSVSQNVVATGRRFVFEIISF